MKAVPQIHPMGSPSRRETILGAATELFSDKGFAGTSMADLADKLGLSKAAIYHYFESKESIFQTLLQSSQEDLEELVNRHKKYPSGYLEARQILQEFAEFMYSHRNVVRLSLSEMHAEVKAQGPRGHQHFQRLQELLAGKKPTAERKMRARIAMGIIFLGIVPPPHEELSEVENLNLNLLVEIASNSLGINP